MVATCWQRSPALPRGFVLEGRDLPRCLYLLPTGIVGGEQAAAAVISGNGWPIAGGGLAFTAVAVLFRERADHAWISLASYAELVDWADAEGEAVAHHVGRLVRRLGANRAPWAGLDMAQPQIMGIVNTTPDSFSDGGDRLSPSIAIQAALDMVQAGATIIDVGGESTRPGAPPVPTDVELARVLPVVSELAQRGIVVSIDTRHAAVMQAAVQAGARIINDVTALEGDPQSLSVAAQSGAALCLMHMRGDPGTMQDDPRYDCAPLDVYDYLAQRVAACQAAGIDSSRITVDPGIGFGKTVHHNAQILSSLALYHGLGCGILLGASRKRFIAALSRDEGPRDRLPGTLAAHLAGLNAGCQIIRVHDVAQTAQAVAVWRGIVCR